MPRGWTCDNNNNDNLVRKERKSVWDRHVVREEIKSFNKYFLKDDQNITCSTMMRML